MRPTKIIISILSLLSWFAQRDAAAAALQQAKFRKREAKRAEHCRQEAARLQIKSNQLSREQGFHYVASTLGNTTLNDAERQARTLAGKLDAMMK